MVLEKSTVKNRGDLQKTVFQYVTKHDTDGRFFKRLCDAMQVKVDEHGQKIVSGDWWG